MLSQLNSYDKSDYITCSPSMSLLLFALNYMPKKNTNIFFPNTRCIDSRYVIQILEASFSPIFFTFHFFPHFFFFFLFGVSLFFLFGPHPTQITVLTYCLQVDRQQSGDCQHRYSFSFCHHHQGRRKKATYRCPIRQANRSPNRPGPEH